MIVQSRFVRVVNRILRVWVVMPDVMRRVVAEGEYRTSSSWSVAGRLNERGACTFDGRRVPQGACFITVSSSTETILLPVIICGR